MESNFTIPQSGYLKNAVSAFWQVEGEACNKTETIIPIGIVEIIFNFSNGGPIRGQLGDKQFQLPKCFINGFNTKLIQLQFPQHQLFFGVRFHPTVIRDILGIPAGEFANHAVDITLIDASINSLWHRLIEQHSFEDRVAVITNWILKKINEISEQDKVLNHILRDHHEIPSVKELSGMLYCSPRHLLRKLKGLTGMSTEEFLLYKKYLYSVELIHHSTLSLTAIAHNCQFADQSHFIKTFRSLANMTPGEYKKTKSRVQGHIYQNVR